jgi:hypothetical protein
VLAVVRITTWGHARAVNAYKIFLARALPFPLAARAVDVATLGFDTLVSLTCVALDAVAPAFVVLAAFLAGLTTPTMFMVLLFHALVPLACESLLALLLTVDTALFAALAADAAVLF